jgi:hypothetical protein
MTEKKKRGGMPMFVPTDKEREDVEMMAGYGVPHEQIASTVRGGIDADTLKKHFKQELIEGKAKASRKVGQSLFQKATGGDTAACIWWTKSQMKWRGENLDVTNSDGSMRPEVIERVIVTENKDSND